MSSVGFQASKIWMCFGKFTAEQVLKWFSGINNSIKPAFEFCESSIWSGRIKRVESFD